MASGLGGRSAANITHHLQGAHFPAPKEDLLLRARDNGAGQDILELLESFAPGEEFTSLSDVIKAYQTTDQAPQSGVHEQKP
jgi:Protein of unknown function (DUF2795)